MSHTLHVTHSTCHTLYMSHTLDVVCATVLYANVLYLNVVYGTLVYLRGLGLEAAASGTP